MLTEQESTQLRQAYNWLNGINFTRSYKAADHLSNATDSCISPIQYQLAALVDQGHALPDAYAALTSAPKLFFDRVETGMTVIGAITH